MRGEAMRKMPKGAYFPPYGEKLCLDCHYARMRTDICGIYCTGGLVKDGKCEKFKPYKSKLVSA